MYLKDIIRGRDKIWMKKDLLHLQYIMGILKKVECKKNILILKVVELYGKMYSYIMY